MVWVADCGGRALVRCAPGRAAPRAQALLERIGSRDPAPEARAGLPVPARAIRVCPAAVISRSRRVDSRHEGCFRRHPQARMRRKQTPDQRGPDHPEPATKNGGSFNVTCISSTSKVSAGGMITPRPSLFDLGRPAAERIGRCDPAETIVIAGTPVGATRRSSRRSCISTGARRSMSRRY